MKFTPFEISKLSEIKAVFAHAELPDPRSTVMLATLRGYAFNSHGQSSFLHIIALMAANMVAIEPDAVILDFTELKYEWGDEMARVLFYCSNHPIAFGEKIPVAVITSKLNIEGLTSLVTDEMDERPEDWLFTDLDTAVKSLQQRLAEPRQSQ